MTTIEKIAQIAGALRVELDLIHSGDAVKMKGSIAAQLRAAGARTLRIEFSGGGDSGDIDSLTVNGTPDGSYSKELEDSGEVITVTNPGHNGENSKDSTDPKVVFWHVITEWAWKFIEQAAQHVDWYNNDGGGGHILFDLADGKFEYEVYYNVSEQVTGAQGEEDI